MLKSIAVIATLGALAAAARDITPRTGYHAEAQATESGNQPYFEFRFPKAEGRVLIERVAIRLTDAPGMGACGFGDPSANRVETAQIQVPLAGVPQRSGKSERQREVIDSAQAIVVDAGSTFTIRVAGRCGAASAKATVMGTWVR